MGEFVLETPDVIVGMFFSMPDVEGKLVFVSNHHHNPEKDPCAVVTEHESETFWHSTVINLVTQAVMQFVIISMNCGCDDENE